MTDEFERRKAEEERIKAEGERVHNEEVRQTHEGAGLAPEVSRVDAESDRDQAEAIRESQSMSRREAEKGRVENETIRIDAESVRVIAEDKRSSVRLFYTKLAVLIALPLAFIALLPAVIGLVLLDRQAEQTRSVVKENRAIITRQAQAAKTNREINKRQAAALTYLCETTNVLSLVIGQLQAVDKSLLNDPSLADTVKNRIRSRVRVYRVAQEEFARREPCQVIE